VQRGANGVNALRSPHQQPAAQSSTLSGNFGRAHGPAEQLLKDMAQPADLEVVRSSYDRVADNYVAMGVGELAPTPWLRAALAAFAEDVNGLGPVLDVGCGLVLQLHLF